MSDGARFMRMGITGEMIAECLGTFVLVLIGDAVVAQVIAGGPALGDHNSISWGWGLGVTFGVYIAGRLTGAHINPAVTLAFAAFNKFPWRKVVPYCVAQTVGAFLAALVVRWNYTEVIAKFDPGHTIKSQFIFSTLPGNGSLPVSEWGAFRDQIIGTALLLLLVMAVTDVLNTPPKANLAPWVIGLIVVAIGFSLGTDAGYAINPARDFGPRLASFLTGYRSAWRDQYGRFYFWVPIIAPFIGGLLGAALYRVLISPFLRRIGHPGPAEEPGRLPETE
jgi:glycerol uptake facilitator protein